MQNIKLVLFSMLFFISSFAFSLENLRQAVNGGSLTAVETALMYVDKSELSSRKSKCYRARLLSQAASGRHHDILELLLRKYFFRKDVNRLTADGMNAFHHAAYSGSVECLKILLHFDALIDLPDEDNRTAFYIAAQKERPGAMLYLMKAGAHLFRGPNTTSNALRTLEEKVKNRKKPNSSTSEVIDELTEQKEIYDDFFNAARTDNPDVIDEAVQSGMKLSQRNEDGLTALHLAARTNSIKVIRFFIDSGFNLNIKKENNDNHSALTEAAYWGKRDAIETLINAGAFIKRSDIRTARQKGHTKIARILLKEITKRQCTIM